MRDALVTVDARVLVAFERDRMHLHGAQALPRPVHESIGVAIAAFERVVRLQPRPLVLRELEAMREKLLARVDAPEDLAPHLFRRLHLASDLVRPFVRHVTIGTGRAHAGAVAVVDRCPELGERVVAHLVAAHAKLFRVCRFQCGIETAPEQDPADEAAEREEPDPQAPARRAERTPPLSGSILDLHRGVSRALRRFPPASSCDARSCSSNVWTSRNSLATSGFASVCTTWH